MKRLKSLFVILFFCLSLFLTNIAGALVIDYDPTTGLVTPDSNLVAGDTLTVAIVRSSGAWADSSYTLTVKRNDRFTSTPIAIVDSFAVDGDTLSGTLNLNTDEAFAYLGTRARQREVMLQLRDSQNTLLLSWDLPLYNTADRPEDTPPVDTDINTYTDNEIDAMIDAIPTGIDLVANPIDGWTVQSTDTGQLEIGSVAASGLLRLINSYTESTTLQSTQYIIVYDPATGTHQKVNINTLINYINSQ